MFTSHHYKIIASAIKEASNSNVIDKNRLVGLLSFFFKTDSGKFDEKKFKEACNG